jgi:outer membrane protein OmpA-like peptidoglycan-associated protein
MAASLRSGTARNCDFSGSMGQLAELPDHSGRTSRVRERSRNELLGELTVDILSRPGNAITEVFVMNYGRINRILSAMTVLAIAFFAMATRESAAQSLQTLTSPPAEFSTQVKDVLFDFDNYENPTDMEVLRANAEWLKAHPQLSIYVEGYADPRGDIIYNLVLSQRRADTVKKILLDAGVSPDRILFGTGWGKLYQTCEDQSEECWSRNRRVIFEFAGENVNVSQSSNLR